jgi:hypothetical protein
VRSSVELNGGAAMKTRVRKSTVPTEMATMRATMMANRGTSIALRWTRTTTTETGCLTSQQRPIE